MRSFGVMLVPGGSPPPGLPADASALVIDVLRATTTLTYALRNGCARVIPVATPEEGLERAAHFAGAVLGGERDGKVIPGYHLGNSPLEYTAERVAGRTLVFASTNGSRALIAASGRRRVLAAFVNLSAAVNRVRDARDVLIVCSGKLGRFSLEDAACAGAIAVRLRALGARPLGAEARLVETLAPRDAADAQAIVQGSSHGRYLRRLGPEFARDVEACAQVDVIGEAFEV